MPKAKIYASRTCRNQKCRQLFRPLRFNAKYCCNSCRRAAWEKTKERVRVKKGETVVIDLGELRPLQRIEARYQKLMAKKQGMVWG